MPHGIAPFQQRKCIDCLEIKSRPEFATAKPKVFRHYCNNCRDIRVAARKQKAADVKREKSSARPIPKELTCKYCRATKPVTELRWVRSGSGRPLRPIKVCLTCDSLRQQDYKIRAGRTLVPYSLRLPFLNNKGQLVKRCSSCGKVKRTSRFGKDATCSGGVRTKCRQCEKDYRKIYIKSGRHTANQSRRRARKAAVENEKIDLTSIIERDKSICYLCGKKLKRRQITIDHVIPLAKGGNHKMDNLRVACRSCNSKKGAKLLEQLTWTHLIYPFANTSK